MTKTTRAYFSKDLYGKLVWMRLVEETTEESSDHGLTYPVGQRVMVGGLATWAPVPAKALERRAEIEAATLADFGPCFERAAKPLPRGARYGAIEILIAKVEAYCAAGPQARATDPPRAAQTERHG